MAWKIDMVSPSGTRVTIERSENNYNEALEKAKKMYPDSRVVSSIWTKTVAPPEPVKIITLEVRKYSKH